MPIDRALAVRMSSRGRLQAETATEQGLRSATWRAARACCSGRDHEAREALGRRWGPLVTLIISRALLSAGETVTESATRSLPG
jgi:hypothetical protein